MSTNIRIIDLQKAGYIFDSEKQIWCRPNYASIDYSDGDTIEAHIAKIIAQATDISVLSPELRKHCVNWPTLYHLSRTRANLLRPLAKLMVGDVLEIGAGCGAITRYLGECGANVVALEGSMQRAAIARSRTRDLDNVTVVAEKFDNFVCDQKFDVITLIGVLEYANLFTTGENAALTMLTRVRELLKPNGKLVIAIENQLGLKYFAGFLEDHLGRSMYGIEGRYRKDQPQTFGRKVLTGLLKQSEFSFSKFLAPFPDYKLPVSILTEEAFDHPEFDAAAFAWQSVRKDRQLPLHCYFSLELAWPEIFKNGLGLEVANSFLIIASPSDQELTEIDSLAYHYSDHRIPQYCKATHFIEISSGNIEVHCQHLTDKFAAVSESPLYFYPHDVAPYTKGTLLSWEFIKIVTRDGWSIAEVGLFIKRYVAILAMIAGKKGLTISLHDSKALLPGHFFDLTPQNIIIQPDGSPVDIDMEWELQKKMELGWLLFRSLFFTIKLVTRFGYCVTGKYASQLDFIKVALHAAGFAVEKSALSGYIKNEMVVQKHITGDAPTVMILLQQPLYGLKKHTFITQRAVQQFHAFQDHWRIAKPIRKFLTRHPRLKVFCRQTAIGLLSWIFAMRSTLRFSRQGE